MYDVISCLGFSFPESYKEQCRWEQLHEKKMNEGCRRFTFFDETVGKIVVLLIVKS